MDRNITAFLAVARGGNLTQAADQVGLTQPALTKKIRRLEQDLGGKLFDRSARGMKLTESGELFLRRAEAIETHWLQAYEEIKAKEDGALDVLAIVSGAAFHTKIAPQLVRELAREFPSTRFVVTFDVLGQSLPMLESGEVHLCLGAFIAEPPDGIVTSKFIDVQTAVYCSNNSPLARLSHVRPSDLVGYEWVVYKRDLHAATHINNFFIRHELHTPRIALEVDALAASMMIVKDSPYLTAAPSLLESVATQAGLVRLPMAEYIWEHSSGAWYRQSSLQYPIIRRALELLPAIVEENIPQGY